MYHFLGSLPIAMICPAQNGTLTTVKGKLRSAHESGAAQRINWCQRPGIPCLKSPKVRLSISSHANGARGASSALRGRLVVSGIAGEASWKGGSSGMADDLDLQS